MAQYVAAKRDLALKHAVETSLRPVHVEEGRIEVALVPGSPASVIQDLSRKLSEWTGRRWLVSISSQAGGPTLAEENAAVKAEREEGIKAHPLVAAVLARFPGAEVVDVRTREEAPIDTEVLAPSEEDLYAGPGADDELEY